MSNAAHSHVKHLKSAPDGRRLTPAYKAVLSQLADDHNEDQGMAFPSVGHLAKRACMSREYCRQLLRELEGMGIIESQPRLRENGGRSSSAYRFCLIDPPFDAKKKADIVQRMRYQELRRQQRAVQLRLNAPPQLGLEGGTGAESSNDGLLQTPPPPPERDGGAKAGLSLLVLEGAGYPVWEGPPAGVGGDPQLGLEGPSNQGGGGIEPLLKPTTEPIAEPLPETTPLPPVSGGVPPGDDDEPLLPSPEARPGEAGWPISVDVAARWVMAKVGIAAHQRLVPVFVEVLTQRVKEQSRETLHQAARMAANNWRVYQRDLHLVRRPWGPVNFFKLGHWQRPRTWHDAELVAQHRTARVGAVELQPSAAMAPWDVFRLRLRRCLHTLPTPERVEALAQYEAGITGVKPAGTATDGDELVLTIVSPDPQRTKTAFSLLRRQVDRELRCAYNATVQVIVVGEESGE